MALPMSGMSRTADWTWVNDDESARKTDLAKLLREIGALNEESYFLQSGMGAVKRKYQRRKLEGDPQNPQLIKTVYGAGYMFAAVVSWT